LYVAADFTLFLYFISDVYFELNGQRVTSASINDIGRGNNALMCRTNYRPCCKANKWGEFTYPNGS